MDETTVQWTEYMQYRAALRGFNLGRIEEIVLYSTERYMDTATIRKVAVGSHGADLVVIPYDENDNIITPVTIHVTTRRQIDFRIQSGRFVQ